MNGSHNDNKREKISASMRAKIKRVNIGDYSVIPASWYLKKALLEARELLADLKKNG